MTYRPQLDGVRAFAVAAVCWSHWERGHQFGLPFGSGVHLFYVLSGFLITRILFDLRSARATIETASSSGAMILARFYVRRLLRIAPAFYVTLALAALASVPLVRESWPWHASYLSNIWIFARAQWPSHISHLWSLAVEEQFYLVWPLVILFAPARAIAPIVVAAIAIAPLFRWTLVALGYRETMTAVLVPGSLDSLGIGALLAWMTVTRPDASPAFARLLLRVGLPIWTLTLGADASGLALLPVLRAVAQTAQACVFGWLVARAADGFSGAFGRLLASSPVTFVGRISYGVYLAHGFAGLMVAGLLARLGITEPLSEPLRFVALASVTLAVATLSWHLVEAPMLALKDRVGYIASGSNVRGGADSTSGLNVLGGSKDPPLQADLRVEPSTERGPAYPSPVEAGL